MADFYPVLSRAIAGLSDPSPQMRRAIYDRARSVLIDQLRGIDPPLSETEIARERLALDETIARIEAEQAGAAPAVEMPVEMPAFRPASPLPAPTTRPPEQAPAPAAALPDHHPNPLPQRSGDVASASQRPLAGLDDDRPAEGDQATFEPASQMRPRIGTSAPPVRQGGRLRNAILAAGLTVTVAGIAIVAYFVNTRPETSQPARSAPGNVTPSSGQPENGAKINERVGVEGAPAPGGGSPSTTEGSPAASTAPAAIAIAQRAVLYIESAETPQQPRTVQGRAVWRLDTENVGSGQPAETVIKATVSIQDAGLEMTFTIRRNNDPAFPASHIVGLRFARTFDDGNGAVREAGVPQFKSDESERGAPLSAITSALGENLFVSALSNVPVEIERNLDIMKKRSWIDIPIRYASGRRAIIAFEKGLSGDQAMNEAFRAWR